MRSQLIVVSLACLFVLPRAVHAQATLSPPLLELGGNIGILFIGGGDSPGLLFTTGPRLTLNATSRDAVEIVADSLFGPGRSRLYGLYLIQYKRLFRPRQMARGATFLTAGLGGDFGYRRSKEWRYERPDGSIYVQPAFTSASLGKPFLGTIGFGIEQMVSRRVAARAEVQVHVPNHGGLGVRGNAGLTIPIGGYREN